MFEATPMSARGEVRQEKRVERGGGAVKRVIRLVEGDG
jgi:hypothetical protein